MITFQDKNLDKLKRQFEVTAPDMARHQIHKNSTQENNNMINNSTQLDSFPTSLPDSLTKVVAYVEQPIPHIEILEQLITKISVVDYRKLAELAEDEKLRNNHYQIITVEQILELAKLNQWGICRNHDFIYLFNGAYWSLIDAEELKTFLGTASEKMGIDKFKARYFNFREQLYKQFIALANLPKPEQSKNVVFVNLKNGTFKITPEEIRLDPFNRIDFMTYQLPFEYEPNSKAPLFEKYLDRVLPNKQLQNILSEYLGYVFIHPCTLKLEKTLLLYGTGANGKSVFYEIVRSLLGEQNTSEYSLQSLTDDTGYYRAMIANKLVNYASEINGRLEASIFKQLVSGEPVEARLPYGNPFTISHYAKLIFNCNELPKDVEQTEAYYRRFLIVPFEITISEAEQDKQLAQKIISSELSGVFNWVLKGLKRLLEQKQFTDCEKVRHAREQYERESDSVRLFIHESDYKADSTRLKVIKDLYHEYRNFCIDDGFKPVNKTNFIKRLKNSKIIVERRGNPAGREKGVPDRRTKLRTLLEPHAENLINKAVELALGGDPHALRLCLERLIPRAKDEPVDLKLPKDITKGESLITIGADILKRLEDQEITPEQANTLMEILGKYRENFIVQELCQNINVLAAKNSDPAAKDAHEIKTS